MHDRRDEEDVDASDRNQLPDLADERIRSGVEGLRHGTAEADEERKERSARNKEPLDRIVESFLAAVLQVHYDAPKTVESDSGIVEHECRVMNQLGSRLEAMSATAARVERHSTDKSGKEWPRIRVVDEVDLETEGNHLDRHQDECQQVCPNVNGFIVQLEDAPQIIGPRLTDHAETAFHMRLVKHQWNLVLTCRRHQSNVKSIPCICLET